MRASVLHWNRPAECVATLEALSAQGVPLEITVVDNGSTPENLRALELALPPSVELLRLPANVGWGAAHNVVLRRWLDRETSEFCLVSAHDALPQGACLGKVWRALEAHPTWGMACPEYGKPERPTYSVLRGARLMPTSIPEGNAGEAVAYCHGTLGIFRRRCLAEIGLFDERYFAYGDETEIGLRARRRGWEVGLVWGAVLVNPGSWSGGPVIAYLWTRNSLRLARTFGGWLGMIGRLGVLLLATGRERLAGSRSDSMSSPRARMLGIRDFLFGHTGGPPPEVLKLR
jgi:N-acetylglucosaminyl-diphospho-decaprenol L-rhamnosyltransferase